MASPNMEIRLTFNVSMVIAVVLAEVVNFVFYNDKRLWGRRLGDRYLSTSIVCDVLLVLLIKSLTESLWSVRSVEDALTFAFFVASVFACLEAPHYVHCSSSFSHFVIHTLHKAVLIFVILLAFIYFKV